MGDEWCARRFVINLRQLQIAGEFENIASNFKQFPYHSSSFSQVTESSTNTGQRGVRSLALAAPPGGRLPL